MIASSIPRLTDDLIDLLKRERELLRAGYPVQTIGLVKEKTELMMELAPLIDAWERGEVADDEISRLQQVSALAQENATHLSAVKNGLSSLMERLSTHAGNTQIGAYDQSGKQLQFKRSTGTYKKSI